MVKIMTNHPADKLIQEKLSIKYKPKEPKRTDYDIPYNHPMNKYLENF